MGGTPLFGGSWGPILQLDLENWIVFLEVVNLTYHILDFVLGQYLPDDPLNPKINIVSENWKKIIYKFWPKYARIWDIF